MTDPGFWAGAPEIFRALQVPLFAILITCLFIAAAFAFYRVATGRNLGADRDDE